jgi:predicted MFS family arabinose efflux permease
MSSTQSRLFLAIVGLASIGGSIGGDAVRRVGAHATFMLAALAEAVSMLLLGIAPGSPVAVSGSALLFGAAYNTVLAVQVIWSTTVFAGRPSAGLAAVMVMNALGLLGGPPIFGALADRFGFLAVFVTGAGLMIAVTILAPRERLEDRFPVSGCRGPRVQETSRSRALKASVPRSWLVRFRFRS